MQFLHKTHRIISSQFKKTLILLQQLTLAGMVAVLLLPMSAIGQSIPPREGDLDTTFGDNGRVFTDFSERSDGARDRVAPEGVTFVTTNLVIRDARESSQVEASWKKFDTKYSADDQLRCIST